MLASQLLGRKSIGIEIEEKYCEIAANRCRQSVMEF
jgi:DNA modification methylase